jgi:hypothetical protein
LVEKSLLMNPVTACINADPGAESNASFYNDFNKYLALHKIGEALLRKEAEKTDGDSLDISGNQAKDILTSAGMEKWHIEALLIEADHASADDRLESIKHGIAKYLNISYDLKPRELQSSKKAQNKEQDPDVIGANFLVVE